MIVKISSKIQQLWTPGRPGRLEPHINKEHISIFRRKHDFIATCKTQLKIYCHGSCQATQKTACQLDLVGNWNFVKVMGDIFHAIMQGAERQKSFTTEKRLIYDSVFKHINVFYRRMVFNSKKIKFAASS